MLGLIRFLLSLSVMAFHLAGAIPNLGLMAVNFFYVISGFLITLVLHETYQFRLYPFAANRFLRLYPSYYVIALVGLLASLLPGYAQFHGAWAGPVSVSDFFANLLIFPWAFLADSIVPLNFAGIDILSSATPHYRIVPSTWSVGVEIVCYFLLWLLVARTVWWSVGTAILAGGWHLYVAFSGLPIALNYFPVPAALLPFALGALAYHVAAAVRLPPLSPKAGAAVTGAVLVAYGALWWVGLGSPSFLHSPIYYANTALAFVAVLVINRSRHRGIQGRVDRWLGDLAYPMFLGHYIFAFIAWLAMGGGPVRSWSVFLAGSALTILTSIAVVMLVDRRVTAVRDRVRSTARDVSLAERGQSPIKIL